MLGSAPCPAFVCSSTSFASVMVDDFFFPVRFYLQSFFLQLAILACELRLHKVGVTNVLPPTSVTVVVAQQKEKKMFGRQQQTNDASHCSVPPLHIILQELVHVRLTLFIMISVGRPWLSKMITSTHGYPYLSTKKASTGHKASLWAQWLCPAPTQNASLYEYML